METQEEFRNLLGKIHVTDAKKEQAINAVNAMYNLGFVSAEELRQQLAEVIPQTMKLAADSMGIGQQELSSRLYDRSIDPVKFIPNFIEELKQNLE